MPEKSNLKGPLGCFGALAISGNHSRLEVISSARWCIMRHAILCWRRSWSVSLLPKWTTLEYSFCHHFHFRADWREERIKGRGTGKAGHMPLSERLLPGFPLLLVRHKNPPLDGLHQILLLIWLFSPQTTSAWWTAFVSLAILSCLANVPLTNSWL